jgi:hypothetical protein
MTKNYTVKGLYQQADEESDGQLPSGGNIFRWGLGCLALVVALSVCGGIYGYANDWFGTFGQVVSPTNVKEQYRKAYDDINALDAIAQNICTAAAARDKEIQGTDAYTQRESQVLAQEQNYQKISNAYDAYTSDVFRGKVVRPRDLPQPAPTEQSLTSIFCPNQTI